jgi:hypothetical protein
VTQAAAQLPVAKLTVSAGANQSANVGTSFANPVAVLVTDSGGTPVRGATVTWTAPAIGAGAAFAASATLTDPSGVAQNSVTANTISGTYAVTAQTGDVSVAITVTNTLDTSPGGGCVNPDATVSDLIDVHAVILRRGSEMAPDL